MKDHPLRRGLNRVLLRWTENNTKIGVKRGASEERRLLWTWPTASSCHGISNRQNEQCPSFLFTWSSLGETVGKCMPQFQILHADKMLNIRFRPWGPKMNSMAAFFSPCWRSSSWRLTYCAGCLIYPILGSLAIPTRKRRRSTDASAMCKDVRVGIWSDMSRQEGFQNGGVPFWERQINREIGHGEICWKRPKPKLRMWPENGFLHCPLKAVRQSSNLHT